MKNPFVLTTMIFLAGVVCVASGQEEKVERIDIESLRGLFEISGVAKTIYSGPITGFLSQGQLACATGANTPDSLQAENSMKIVGAPGLKTSSRVARTETRQYSCSRYGYGVVSDISRALFTDILGASSSSRTNYEYKVSENDLKIECANGDLMEVGDQGIWPVASFLDKNRAYTLASRQEVTGTGCHDRDTYTKETINSYVSNELVSTGNGQYIPKINSSKSSGVHVEINFGRLLQGGSQFKMQMVMSGYNSVPLNNARLQTSNDKTQLDRDRFVTWEGNFRLVDCTDSEGLREATRAVEKIVSLEQALERRNEMALPGYRTCTFIAPKMTTKDVAQWNEKTKVIIPTLRDVVLEVNAASANIRFAAYSGMPFQAQQILSVKPAVDQKTVDTAVLKAEKLLEIMNGSLDQVWEDYRSNDTMIPKTFAYFNLRKGVITDLVASLDQDLKKGGLPFMAGLEIMVSLKKAWAFIDRSVGMATKNEKTLQNVMNLPQTSVTGSYFSEQGAALVKPLSTLKREVPVYDSSKASGSSWFDRKNSGSNYNSDGYNN